MASTRSHPARRREVRRNIARPGPVWLATLRSREVLWSALIVSMLGLLAAGIAIYYHSRVPYHVGEVVQDTVLSRVEFKAVHLGDTEKNREYAARDVLPVYRHNEDLLTEVRDSVLGTLRLAEESYDQVPPEYRESVGLTPEAHELLKRYADPADGDGLDPGAWNDRTENLLRRLFNQVILDDQSYQRVLERSRPQIHAIHPNPAEGDDAEKLYTERVLMPVGDRELIRSRLDTVAMDFQPELRDTVTAVVERQVKPTYFIDRAETERRRAAARENTPQVETLYGPNSELVPAGKTLSLEDLKLLRDEAQAYKDQQSAAYRWLGWLGEAGTVLLLVAAVWVYVYTYNHKVRRNPVRGVVLATLLLGCQAAAAVIVSIWPGVGLGGAAFPALLGATVLAIVYGQRFALSVGAAVTALIALTLRLPVEEALVVMVGVAVGVSLLDEVRSRSKLVKVGLWSGLAMMGGAVVVGLGTSDFTLPATWSPGFSMVELSVQWKLIGASALYCLLAGLAVGLIVQGVLPTIEQVFHVTTAMTLKDLNDAGHPLLQKLAHEAPGTYQHSLRIADMSEAAAEAIGADPLLCRVGAMYHDIGKVNKPMYFIENQGGGPNKHNKLSPAMSLLIILGHVKDGVEMAREYALPSSIRHIIESHHGTTLVEYFFHAAKKQKAEEDKPAPSEFEFRYPGPKPESREAAIMLLCDGIEGAARAMDEPTAVRLEQLVHAMANKRLMDGQFDQCPLTLRDLSRVEAAITKTLCAVYHTRIKYPDGKKKEPPPQTGPQVKSA